MKCSNQIYQGMVGKTTRLVLLLAALSFINTVEGACKTDLNDYEMAVLEAHNRFREQHEDTEPLCYGESGDDVTFTAQEWTEKQAADKAMQHSSGGGFGENIATAGSTGDVMEKYPAYMAAAGMWYDEIKDWDFEKSASKGGVTGHFTQVVWKNSKQVNCGYATYQRENWNWYIVTCQYYPPGNFNNDYANNVAPIKSNETKTCPIPTVADATLMPMPTTGFLNVGAKVTVMCNSGFTLEGENYEFTCGADGRVMPEMINCKSDSTETTTCPIPTVADATLMPMPTTGFLNVGAKVTVMCNSGFTLEGENYEFTCGADGRVMPEMINCKSDSTETTTCPIPTVADATLMPMPTTGFLNVGAKVTVMCNSGFTLEGENYEFTCGADGRVMPEMINCKSDSTETTTCPIPTVADATLMPMPTTGFLNVGAKVTVICNSGFTLEGENYEFTCGADGRVMPEMINCKSDSTETTTCPIPTVADATLMPMPTTGFLNVGAKVTVICNSGFTLEGEYWAFTCGADGLVKPDMIHCKSNSTETTTCPLPTVADATLSPMPEKDFLDVGAQVTVICNSGFTLEGEYWAFTCGADGLVMPDMIHCKSNSTEGETCDRPYVDPAIAKLEPETDFIMEGESYTMTCMDGYSKYMYCEAGGKFSPDYVTCDSAISGSIKAGHSLLVFFVLYVALFN